jgi:hypothetical protein
MPHPRLGRLTQPMLPRFPQVATAAGKMFTDQ